VNDAQTAAHEFARAVALDGFKGVNPGQPIRYEPEKSRFQPLTVENWMRQFYAPPVDVGGGLPGNQPRKTGTTRFFVACPLTRVSDHPRGARMPRPF
jgi:hypothetical protein